MHNVPLFDSPSSFYEGRLVLLIVCYFLMHKSHRLMVSGHFTKQSFYDGKSSFYDDRRRFVFLPMSTFGLLRHIPGAFVVGNQIKHGGRELNLAAFGARRNFK